MHSWRLAVINQNLENCFEPRRREEKPDYLGEVGAVLSALRVIRSGMDLFVVGLGVAAVGYFVGEWITKLP